MRDVLNLPKSWVQVTIADLGKVVSGGTPSTKEKSYWGGNISWISPSDLTGYSNKNIAKGAKSITQEGLKKSSATIIPAGSIHFSSRAPIGYTVISSCDMTTNQGFKSLIPAQGVFNEYIYYYFKSAKQLAESKATGTTFKEISGTAFGKLPVPLPPTNEQHRIVAKIEELFSELDKGIENLKTARAQLKVYRQTLLKHAFEGKLTAQWRAENQGKLETAAALLKHIQQERAQRYQQQLADWEKSPSVPLLQRGKTTSAAALTPPFEKGGQGGFKGGRGDLKLKAPKSLPPLTAEELAELPELPEGWGWVKLGEVFNVYVGSTPSRKRADFWNGDISWVSSGEVAFCRIKETKEKITRMGYENASTEIHPIGTVMLAMIGEGKTRGQAAILDIEASHNQNTAAIRVSETGCSTGFVYQYLVYQYELTRKIGSGNNQKALNKERVSDLIFPLCCIDEMDEVVRRIDEKLSEVDQLELTLTTSLQQAEALRQSILKKAFSGQLVPQDPHDEPASALLARIRAERENGGKNETIQRRTRKVSA